MRIICVCFFCFEIFFHHKVLSQSVGVGTTSPNENAALHVVAPNKNQGVLVPGLTTEERLREEFTDRLGDQDKGLLVFDLTENRFYFWTEDGWSPVLSGTIGRVLEAGSGVMIIGERQIVNTGDTDSTDDITINTEAGGALTGLYPSPQIAEQAVSTVNLADSAVTGDKVSDNTIGVNKLSGLADVTTGRNSLLITNNSNLPRWFQPSLEQVIVTDNSGQITSLSLESFERENLPDGNIYVGVENRAAPLDASGNGRILVGNGTSLVSVSVMGDISIDGAGTTQISPDAVGSAEIMDESVTPLELANEAVTTDKIALNAVQSDRILDGAVTLDDLADGSVNSAKIADGAIVNSDVNSMAGILVAKLESMNTGEMIFGNGVSDGVPTIGTLGGDATIDASGNLTLSTLTAVDIDGGTIDDVPIGSAVPSTGSFTTLAATDGSNIEAIDADNITQGTIADALLPAVGPDDVFTGGIDAITVDLQGRVISVTTNPPPSDIRLKKDLQILTTAPQSLSQLQAYRYRWKDEKMGDRLQIGLIAQEVEKVFPELVQTRSDGYKGVHYQGLIPVLVEAAKANQAQIDSLILENESLKSNIEDITDHIQHQAQELRELQLLVKELLKKEGINLKTVSDTKIEEVGRTNR